MNMYVIRTLGTSASVILSYARMIFPQNLTDGTDSWLNHLNPASTERIPSSFASRLPHFYLSLPLCLCSSPEKPISDNDKGF